MNARMTASESNPDQPTLTPFQRLIRLFDRAKGLGAKPPVSMHEWATAAELTHQAMTILGIPEAEHNRFEGFATAPYMLGPVPSVETRPGFPGGPAYDQGQTPGHPPDEPARPVEDREPAGPYAPTRDDRFVSEAYLKDLGENQFEAGYRQGWRERHVYGTPRYKGLPTLTNRPEGGTELGDYLVEQFGSVGTRIDGLVDVVIGIGRQMTDNRVWESERFDRIDTALTDMATLTARCPIDHQAVADQAYEKGRAVGKDEQAKDCKVDHETAEEAAFNRGLDKGFERGRQQGDADRAQRGQTDHGPNGPWAQQAEALARTRAEGFKAGREIGKAEREAELLDQGWTPPGDKGERPNRQFTALDMLEQSGWTPPGNRPFLSIDTEDLEVTSGPTDYEVWRDALTLAATFVTGDGADASEVEGLGQHFWELLQQVPVRKYDDADEYVCEACGDEFPSAGQRAAHEDEKHAATGQ